MKTIDDLIFNYQDESFTIHAQELRELIAKNIKNHECFYPLSIEAKKLLVENKKAKLNKRLLCNGCVRLIELMPSVKELL